MEIGCGPGQIGIFVRERGRRVVGLDLSHRDGEAREPPAGRGDHGGHAITSTAAGGGRRHPRVLFRHPSAAAGTAVGAAGDASGSTAGREDPDLGSRRAKARSGSRSSSGSAHLRPPRSLRLQSSPRPPPRPASTSSAPSGANRIRPKGQTVRLYVEARRRVDP